jgi:hypothetical protein
MQFLKLTYRSVLTDEAVNMLCPWADNTTTPPGSLIFHREGKIVRFALTTTELITVCL